MEFSDQISVKNKSLISNITVDPDSSVITVSIQNHLENGDITKLGHVLNELPSGIIDKGSTGIGGTSLELDCDRPSIVVEPYNYTAGIKSKFPSITKKYKIHWFGSVQAKNDILGWKPEFSNSQDILLELYLAQCLKNNQPPKILVIPDQLIALKEILDRHNDYNWEEFHLLFDEIDSMQEQISFRSTMHQVSQLHLAHPKDKRTLLSATLNKFHDPQLEDEPHYAFRYNEPNIISVDLIKTTGIAKRTSIKIEELLSESDTDKILIAFNHKRGIQNTINYLYSNKKEIKDQIAVLCGSESQAEFPDYIYPIDREKLTLPKRINFITAAYFNGHDILEKAHIISCIDARTSTMRLNPKVLYQIQGRCRNGTISQTWIANFAKPYLTPLKLNTLIDYANLTKKLLDVTDEIKTYKNQQISLAGKTMENIFYSGMENMPSVFDRDLNGDRQISYFKIDSLIDDNNTQQILSNHESFKQASKDFFNVSLVSEYLDEKDQKKEDPASTALKASNYFDIKEFKSGTIQNKEFDMAKKLFNTTTAKKVISIYKLTQGKEIFLHDQVRSVISKLLKKDSYALEIQKFYRHILYHFTFTVNYNDSKHTYLPSYLKSLKKATLGAYTKFMEHFALHLQTVYPMLSKTEKKAISYFLKQPKRMKGILYDLNTYKENKKVYYSIKTFNVFGVLNLNITTELNLNYKNTKRLIYLNQNSPLSAMALEYIQVLVNDEGAFTKYLNDGFPPVYFYSWLDEFDISPDKRF